MNELYPEKYYNDILKAINDGVELLKKSDVSFMKIDFNCKDICHDGKTYQYYNELDNNENHPFIKIQNLFLETEPKIYVYNLKFVFCISNIELNVSKHIESKHIESKQLDMGPRFSFVYPMDNNDLNSFYKYHNIKYRELQNLKQNGKLQTLYHPPSENTKHLSDEQNIVVCDTYTDYNPEDSILIKDFSLGSVKHTGKCNFSAIDNVKVVIDVNNKLIDDQIYHYYLIKLTINTNMKILEENNSPIVATYINYKSELDDEKYSKLLLNDVYKSFHKILEQFNEENIYHLIKNKCIYSSYNKMKIEDDVVKSDI